MAREKNIRITGFEDEMEERPEAGESPADENVVEKSDDTEVEESRGDTSETHDETEQLRAKVAELEDRLLRASADFDNYRKRIIRQQEEALRSANDALLTDLLEVVDNFERALEHLKNKRDDDSIGEGMQMIYNQMRGILDRYGVRPIEAIGRRFDPQYHEALMRVDTDDYDEGVVAAEVNKGYMVGNRVLRHARVAVSTGRKSDSEHEEPMGDTQ
jgi:molecular chaperone GrpE